MNNGFFKRKLSLISKRLTNIIHKSSLVNCEKRMGAVIKMLRSIIRPEMMTPTLMMGMNDSKRVQYSQRTRLLDKIIRRIKKGKRVKVAKANEEAEQLLIAIEEMINDYLIEEGALIKEVKAMDDEKAFTNEFNCGLFGLSNLPKKITCNYFDDAAANSDNAANAALDGDDEGNTMYKGNSFIFKSFLFDT